MSNTKTISKSNGTFRGICDNCGKKLVEVTRRIEVDGKYYFFCCDGCVLDFIRAVWVEVSDPFVKPDWQH